jgi:TrpR-related protein YerC/YecD
VARFQPKNLSEENAIKLVHEFYKTVTLLETYNETKNFFQDFLTGVELAMFSRRLQIAKMLVEGYSYEVIMEVLRVGKNTVSRVSRWLDYGGGGFRKVIEKLLEFEEKEERAREEKYDPLSWENIKRRYAVYYWPERAMAQLEKKISVYLKQSRKLKSIPTVS